jgi:hypothetical protein
MPVGCNQYQLLCGTFLFFLMYQYICVHFIQHHILLSPSLSSLSTFIFFIHEFYRLRMDTWSNGEVISGSFDLRRH